MTISYTGIAPERLARWRSEGIDDGGNPIVPFTAKAGEWPMRCCLRDSDEGDRVAIVAASPFPWQGAYAARGPISVHVDGCAGYTGSYPAQFDARDQIVRAFGTDEGREHTQVYDLNRLVPAGQGLQAAIAEVLADERVEFVQCCNVKAGCYSFTARLD